ncbi:hypothetical protein GCM10009865_38510 [Aeromicrobium ponti]|uniref:Inhibitor of cysteine peptidase n=2 Tax=Cytobacillus oceanisediminis TaxID=665099 RepID=A0A562JIZ2_9BACI|nr:inhibitor of cysteine peptidase [Cytobacillus oceanisediminis]
MVHAGFELNGQSLSLKVNNQMQILLPSNPSTGYMWVEKGIAASLHNLQLDCSDLMTDGPVGQYGKGGFQRWVFTAVSPGHSVIIFHYQQPWDEMAVDQTYKLTVVVSE